MVALLPQRPHGLVFLLIGSLMGPACSSAGTWIIPDQFPTIQAALDSLVPWPPDTLMIRPGHYPERLVVPGGFALKNILTSGDPDSMVKVDALTLEPGDSGNHIWISGFQSLGPVVAYSGGGPSVITFVSCQIDSGWLDPSGNNESETDRMTLHRCRLFGPVRIHAWETTVDSSEVHGPLYMRGQWRARARGNRFENVDGAALTVDAELNADITGNVVQGGTYGFNIEATDGLLLFGDNLIEGCSGFGADLHGHQDITVSGNRIVGCGGDGIRAIARLQVRNNTILECAGAGMILRQSEWQGVAEFNTIGRCGDVGIRIVRENRDELDPWIVRNNTIFSCEGNGFEIDESANVHNNVGYGNGGFGLTHSGAFVPVLACNDWYANTAGAVSSAPGATDLDVDPQFCDLDTNDVSLTDKSPLVSASGCGLIGARGAGCAETAALIGRFGAARVDAGVELVWTTESTFLISEVHVERAESVEGPWQRVACERRQREGAIADLDRTASDERELAYRLVMSNTTPSVVLAGPITVAGAVTSRLALRILSPNPGAGAATFAFELPHAATISLDVFDVQGRIVATLARGSWPSGLHTVLWNGQESAPPRPGVYLVRLRVPSASREVRVVRMR